MLTDVLFLLELHMDWRTQAPNLTVQNVREILKIIESKHKARLSACDKVKLEYDHTKEA